MGGYVVVGPWGEASGSVPWSLMSPAEAWAVISQAVPIFVRPIGPGPLESDLVDQLNAARETFVKSINTSLMAVEKAGAAGVTLATGL
jgi:hypothetical protein